jgi:WD40 repeat protein/serine/threonine protein kinase
MSRETCQECGAAIPADSPGGFCAQCLLKLALGKEDSAPADPLPPNQLGQAGAAASAERPPSPESQPVRAAPPTEKPGDRIGRYRLLQEIGHGGCGVVYMAEQEEPVRRKVAFKVIKFGMDTRQVVARFEAERQALALMDHPNIATVLDAGATDTGRPYFVMELVGGIRITDYSEQHELTIPQRLELFIHVCRAIQHAHQKGVIHRDIKPSNVLVTNRDGVAVPKVIDFGIAKATQGRLTDQTLFTAFEQFIGTPAYMSPEQAQLGGVDVDTRSDIYSLGVLLYELLTGRTPFDTNALMAAGLDEMRRTIREVEPVKPSTRLTQERMARSVASSKSEIRNPKSEIDKDLDWIVMKCLEKDRARRYETANGLARDIERHLNCEPVLARPPSKLYEFQKTVRRHKFGFGAATALIAVLSLGCGGVFWQWRQAMRHARLEENERYRAEQATQRALATLNQMEAIELRRAEEYYEAGDRGNMLPYLAFVLRQNPTNRIAAERLFSTLSHRNWACLACPPLMHSNRVTSAMFSKDGKWVVTSAADNTAWVWDANTGQPVSGPLVHQAEINTAEFSPDGQLVVTASDDRTARVWDARTGRPVTDPIPHPQRVELARFSPNGQTFVTLCDDRVARLWNARTGQSIVKPLQHGGGPAFRYFRECDFSPDGTLLATAAWENGRVRIWNCRTGEIAYNLEHGSSGATCVRFSPDGRRLAAAFYTNTTVIWNLAVNPPQAIPMPQQGIVTTVEFSPEGQRVVTASSGGTVQVWDAVSGQPIGPALHHEGSVRSAIFSPEGLRFLTASWDQTVRVWDAETGEPLTEPIRVEHGAFDAQFHPDGQRVLSVSNGKAVLVWWVTRSVSLAVHEPFNASCIEFSHDSTKVVVGGEQGSVQIWEPLAGRLPTILSGHSDYVQPAAFSADGTYVATGSSDMTARVWSVTTGKPVGKPLKIGPPGAQVFAVQFSSDSRRMLTATWPGTARLWEAASGKPASPPLGEEDGVRAAQLSPNGKWVATGGTNGSARIWDGATGRQVGAVMRHEGPVLAVCFSPDSTRLLTGGADKTARLWAVPSGDPLAKPIPHSLGLYQVHFSPDGTRFLTVVNDRPWVRIWDTATARLQLEISAENTEIADFSPDGRRVMTVSARGKVQLWDAQTGERFSEALSQEARIGATRFSPDGKLLAAAYSNGAVQFWEVTEASLPVPSWLPELAEALAGQRFNQQGRLEPVLPVELWAAQEKMSTGAQRPDNGFSRWAKWFLSPPNSRTVLPSSPLTLAQRAESLAGERVSYAAAKEALLLQPTNVIAMDAVALTTTNSLQADWLSGRAVDLAPDSHGVLWAREAVLTLQNRFEEALAAMERSPSLWAHNPWIWRDKGAALEKLGRLNEAHTAYSRSIEIARNFDELRIPVQEARWRLLRRMNRFSEAQKDFLEAKRIPLRATLPSESRFTSIDLRPHINQGLQDLLLSRTLGATNPTAPLHITDNVPFELCGYILLHGRETDPAFPSRVLNIQVGQRCRTLHFLQSCDACADCPAPNSTAVGSYLVHYTGETGEKIPILATQDVRYWFDPDKELGPATKAWSVMNEKGEPVRLFKRSWANPHPNLEIQSIDFLSAGPDSPHPILFAITAER